MDKIITIFKAPFKFILWTYDETKKRCPNHPVGMWMLFGLSNLIFIILILVLLCNFHEAIKWLAGVV